jgi:hypothetical protein
MTSEYLDLQQRLAKLEKQNRTFRRIAIALLVAVGAVLLMGQAAPQHRSIQAEEFILTDGGGKARASWTVTKGDPTLMFYDHGGDSRMALFLNQDEPQIDLVGAKGAGVASVQPTLVELTDSTGRIVSLKMVPTAAGFTLEDASKVRASLVLKSDEPGLVLFDKNGKPATLLTDDKDGPSLDLEDAQGYSAILGSGGLVTPTTGETHQTSAASLILFDKDKNVIWKAP